LIHIEGAFELLLANAMHVKTIPGRKSDVRRGLDGGPSAHGLIRGSFGHPGIAGRDAQRKQPVQDVARCTLRIQKVLEDVNIKDLGLARCPGQERTRHDRGADRGGPIPRPSPV
jgi:hypothetical protein